MSATLDAARQLAKLGLVPRARLQRLEIHESFWLLRDSGTPPGEAALIVAGCFSVSEATVESYAKNRHLYDPSEKSAEPSPPQS